MQLVLLPLAVLLDMLARLAIGLLRFFLALEFLALDFCLVLGRPNLGVSLGLMGQNGDRLAGVLYVHHVLAIASRKICVGVFPEAVLASMSPGPVVPTEESVEIGHAWHFHATGPDRTVVLLRPLGGYAPFA